jgi:hypothetical protein
VGVLVENVGEALGVAVNVGVVEDFGEAVGVAVRVIMALTVGAPHFLLKEFPGSFGFVRPEGESSQNGNARLGLARASKAMTADRLKTQVVRNMEWPQKMSPRPWASKAFPLNTFL